MTPRQVLENPSAYQGTVVIWGGRIIKTVNDTNGAAIYILAMPLNRHGKPDMHANSEGRFIANSTEFLDPEEYKHGRLVTVAGDITGVETLPLQKVKYTYSVVAIRQLHLWPVARKHYYYPARAWGGYYPAWDWGCYPGWSAGWGWYYPGWDWDEDYPGDRD